MIIESENTIKIRYDEVDKMGYVYHGNYAKYYHISRTELLRKIGISDKMKILKILIIAALLLHLGSNLKAQNINYGVLAGYVCTKPHVIKFYPYSTRLFYPMHSFNVNGFIEYRFQGAWGIVAEPGFIRKGGVVDDDHNFQLYYVQLPILANLYCTDRFYISFGPEFAYLINKDENLPSKLENYCPLEENAFEISGLIGVNYNITKNIDLGLRYNHSLTYFSVVSWINPRYPQGHGIMGHSNIYNQYLQFIVRYKIKLIK